MESYIYINNLLTKINNTQGTNAKKALLKEGLNSKYKDDFKLVLRHLYDPQIITGISKKKFESAIGDMPLDLNWWTIPNFLNFIRTHNSGKLDDANAYKSLYYLIPDARFLIYSLITKDINIGISRGIVEKFIEIPKFEIMLGVRPDLDDIDWDREFILTQKLDGVNLTCIKRGSSIEFLTRQGKKVSGLNDLEKEYQKMPDGVYFGEALYLGDVKDRKECFRLTTAELSQKKSNKSIIHYLFDYVSLNEWDSSKFITPYSHTYEFILEQTLKANTVWIKVVPFVYRGSSKEMALQHLRDAKSNDWEGLVLRYSSSVYQKERSKDFVKLKPRQEDDFKIIGVQEHKRGNKLGALIIDVKGNNVHVGTGFTDAQRKIFWKEKDSIIGLTCVVEFMEFSENKQGNISLRLPSFVRLRNDK